MDSDALDGQETVETFTPTLARKVAAMLDLDGAAYTLDTSIPRGWHFVLMPSTTRRSHLRADGFAGLGVALPDLGLPRLMLAGRHVTFNGDLMVGSEMCRRSVIESIEEKGGDRPRAIVRIRHELRAAGSDIPALVEKQTFMLMPESGPYRAAERALQAVSGGAVSRVVPDATLLFQFSALGFNAHKIHLDRDYARNVEGFPDLVVNGGLTALLITEFVRRELGLTLGSMEVKYLAPLFCDRALTMAATRIDEDGTARWQINVHDDMGTLAAVATVRAA